MSMDYRPKALDALLAAANLPDEEAATAKARTAIAPLEKAIRAAKAQEHAELRAETLTTAAEHLRTVVFPEVYDDMGQKAAAGVDRACGVLRRMARASRPSEQPPTPQQGPDTVRVPVARSVVYVVRGVPEVPDQYTKGLAIAPTEITLTYRAAPDELGRVHAYVKGWWTRDGARVPMDKPVGRHFHGDLAGWPEWLAAEARLHDPNTDDEEPTLGGAMRIVESWFVDVNDGHGFDASDLVHQLEEAGYRLPSDQPS